MRTDAPPEAPWVGRACDLRDDIDSGFLVYSAASEAMSIEKRYFTSDLSMRS